MEEIVKQTSKANLHSKFGGCKPRVRARARNLSDRI